jgi:hypothetical protein
MWEALARCLGSNATPFAAEEAKTIFITETNERGTIEVH